MNDNTVYSRVKITSVLKERESGKENNSNDMYTMCGMCETKRQKKNDKQDKGKLHSDISYLYGEKSRYN